MLHEHGSLLEHLYFRGVDEHFNHFPNCWWADAGGVLWASFFVSVAGW